MLVTSGKEISGNRIASGTTGNAGSFVAAFACADRRQSPFSVSGSIRLAWRTVRPGVKISCAACAAPDSHAMILPMPNELQTHR
jgi:hypothetical protein